MFTLFSDLQSVLVKDPYGVLTTGGAVETFYDVL